MTALDRWHQLAEAENAAMRKVFAGNLNFGVKIANGRKCPKVAARRERIAELYREGMTHAQIAEALGMNRNTVTHDCALMGLARR